MPAEKMAGPEAITKIQEEVRETETRAVETFTKIRAVTEAGTRTEIITTIKVQVMTNGEAGIGTKEATTTGKAGRGAEIIKRLDRRK